MIDISLNGEERSASKYSTADFDIPGALRLLNAIKAQAVQDYIMAVESHNAVQIREIETFFEYCGKLDTARYTVRYIVPIFRIMAMENFPKHWEEDPEKLIFSFRCPICNNGDVKYHTFVTRKYTHNGGDPVARFTCCNCGFTHDIKTEGESDEDMEKRSKDMKDMAYRTRERMFRSEYYYELQKNPKMKPEEIDELTRRLADKWKI